jgi:ABC-type multidrug transport system ATPase subunit
MTGVGCQVTCAISLKGLSGNAKREAIANMMREVGLTEKAHTQENALSGEYAVHCGYLSTCKLCILNALKPGGMKRKLSLGIALIGSPRFVLLGA